MRLYITPSVFISVLEIDGKLSCQVMNLTFGIGGYPATYNDDPILVVSCVDFNYPCEKFISWNNVVNYHEEIMKTFYK